MAEYPITTSMQFLINTLQPITEEEKEAIREQLEWKPKMFREEDAYAVDYGHDITFGWHTDPESSNFNYVWITVQLSAHERNDRMTLADIREVLYNKACGMILSVINPMRGNYPLTDIRPRCIMGSYSIRKGNRHE